MDDTGDSYSDEYTRLETLLSQPSFQTLQPLAQAVDVYKSLSRLTIISAGDLKKLHNVLKDLLFKNYKETNSLSDLDDAIISARFVSDEAQTEQVVHLSEESIGNLEALNNLLYTRFLRTTKASDIEEIVKTAKSVVNATSLTDRRRFSRLSRLATYLYAHFRLTSNIDKLNASIRKCEEALSLSPSKYNRMVCLHSLTARLFSKFEISSSTKDLEQAESFNAKAITAATEVHLLPQELLLYQARLAFARFGRSHFWGELGEAIRLTKEAMQVPALGLTTVVALHQNLSIFHLQSFQISKRAEDLNLAHQQATTAMEKSKGMKLVQNVIGETLLECLLTIFSNNGGLMQLRNVTDLLEDQIDVMHEGAARSRKMQQYRNLLTLKYEHTGEHLDLVFLCYEALRMVQDEAKKASSAEESAEYHRKIDSLTFLFGELFRFLLVPEFIDVRDALMTSIHNAFLDHKAEGIPGALTSFLKKLEVMSYRLDMYGRDATKKKDSIIGPKSHRLVNISAIMEQARLNARTSEDPRPLSQFRYRLLNVALRFPPEKKVDLQDARRAVSQFSSPSEPSSENEKLPPGEEYYQLSKVLYQHFEENESKEEEDALSILVEAIGLSKNAMDYFDNSSEEYKDAAKQYIDMISRRSDIDKTRESIDSTIEAIESIPDVFGGSFLKLVLANQLRGRFLQFKELEDLQRASMIVEEIVPSTTTEIKDNTYRPQELIFAALVLKLRYQFLGDSGALDKGISYIRHVVKPSSWGKEPLSNEELAQDEMMLGFMLRLRYRRTESIEDIEEAAQLGRSALRTMKRSTVTARTASTIRNNVAIIFEDLYKRKKNLQDLDEAISLAERVEDKLKDINLANMLFLRYGRSASLDDLDRAVSMARSAVLDAPNLGAHSMLVLSDSAEVLFAKYNSSQEESYLEEAIHNLEMGLAHMPENVPWRAVCLLLYTDMLQTKAAIRGDDSTATRKHCIELLEESWQNEHGTPPFRVQTAYRAGLLHSELGNWDAASFLLEGAVEYLFEVSPPFMDLRDRQRQLERLSGLAADAAAVALKAGKTAYGALRLLELSRGVIMGSTIDFRRDISQLAETNPELARNFNRLRMALDSIPEGMQNGRQSFPRDGDYFDYSKKGVIFENKEPVGIARRKMLHQEMSQLLATIREIPGQEDFLSLPKSETLAKMAQGGPIVFVLCSKAVGVGNAIIAQSTGTEAIELPKLTTASATKRLARIKEELPCGSLRTYASRNKNFRDELLWLWQVIVEPVLRHIHPEFQESVVPHEIPHIHWIGVGILSCIPFHAAGDHSSGSVSNTISHAISSYASSLRALQYVMKPKSKATSLDRLLVATMVETPGAAPLPSARKELSTIIDIVGRTIPIGNLQNPTPNKVLEELPHYNLTHFACHGISDSADPFNSRLLLNNANERQYGSSDKANKPSTLSVSDLLAHRSPRADLAYISACSTANIRVTTLADESVHIASAFQLAGFRHVVASLWEQKDSICLEIAAKFYHELFRLRTLSGDEWPVAEALHNAISAMHHERPGMVLQWASFVHIGA